MCRLMAYIGPPALVADVVLWPARSIIKQSYDARERLMDASLPQHLAHGNLNGDGFGIGWFNPEGTTPRADPTPCTFTSITPAWNNENLGRLSCKITSPLVFAHVRAAYPGMPVSEQNCHPFQWGRYLFMHNGVIGDFMRIRRAMLASLSEAAFNAVQSFHSDSAVAFAMFLNHLPDMHSQLQPAQLLAAIEATVADITRFQQEAGATEVSLLNFVVSDGPTLVATRYVSRDDCAAATMYYAEGAAFRRASEVAAVNGGTQLPDHIASTAVTPAAGRETSIADEAEYTLTYGERGSRVVLVASEPITQSAGHWVAVPRNSALVVSRGKGGLLDVVQTPLAASGVHPRQPEIQQCLEAISQSVAVSARPWTGLAAQQARPPLPPLSSAAMLATAASVTLDAGSNAGLALPDSPRKRGHRQNGSLNGAPKQRRGATSSNAAAAASAAAAVKAVTAEEHQLTGHTSSVLCVRLLRGRLLFSGSADGTLKVWDLDTCKCAGTLLRAGKPVASLEIAAGRVYAAAGRRVYVWALPCLTPVASVEVSKECGAICSLCVGPRETLYIGGQDTRMQAFKLPLIMDAPAAVAVAASRAAPDGLADGPLLGGAVATLRASEGINGSSSALDGMSQEHSSSAAAPGAIAAGAAAAAVNGAAAPQHSLPQQAPAAATGGTQPASVQGAGPQYTPASFEGLLTVATPIAVTDATHGHCCSVNAIARCTGYVCSGGGDAAIRVWKSRTLEPVSVLRGHRGSILAMFALDNLLLSGGRDNTVRVWDMEALVCRRTLTGHKDDVLQISGLRLADPAPEPCSAIGERDPSPPPDPDLGALFATASADGSVRLWRSRCWTCVRIFACAHSNPAASPCPFLSTAMTEKYTLTGSPDGVIRLWASSQPFRRARAQPDGSAATASCPTAGSISSKEAADDDCSAIVQGTAKRRKLNDAGDLSARIGREMERSLRDFVRLATVSRDPGHREDCFRGAKFLGTLLESLGAEIKMAHGQEDRNPVVLGRIGRDHSKPTVCFYGHYDVQPAMERDWKTDPFELHSIDGYFYARGASDNKGPILAFVYAVKELLEEGRPGAAGPAGSLPCNVAFVVEGEEENGSAGFREVLRSNKRWFEGVSLAVISNTLWVGERVPCLTYGMRGMISLSIEVAGPQRDLHSGNDGGVFNEPLADLTKVLASLIDSRNNIQVPGFYDGVREGMLDAAVSRLEASDEFQLPAYQQSLGVPSFVSHTSQRDLLSARWCEPSLSVVDVRVGDDTAANDVDDDEGYRFGPTRFSVVPRSATGHVSIRFVPDQDANRLFELFRAHVQHEFRKLRSANTVSVRLRSVGDWYEADPGSRLFCLAERAITRQWGRPPLYVREGGTMPVASALEQELGAPALLIPFGQASDACHLANERIAHANLLAGKNVIKHLLHEVASA